MKKNEEKIKEKTDADRLDEMFISYSNLEKKQKEDISIIKIIILLSK